MARFFFLLVTVSWRGREKGDLGYVWKCILQCFMLCSLCTVCTFSVCVEYPNDLCSVCNNAKCAQYYISQSNAFTSSFPCEFYNLLFILFFFFFFQIANTYDFFFFFLHKMELKIVNNSFISKMIMYAQYINIIYKYKEIFKIFFVSIDIGFLINSNFPSVYLYITLPSFHTHFKVNLK